MTLLVYKIGFALLCVCVAKNGFHLNLSNFINIYM